MDKSRYRVFFGLLLSDADKEKVRNKVTSAVGMLHQEGFVMGTFEKPIFLSTSTRHLAAAGLDLRHHQVAYI